MIPSADLAWTPVYLNKGDDFDIIWSRHTILPSLTDLSSRAISRVVIIVIDLLVSGLLICSSDHLL